MPGIVNIFKPFPLFHQLMWLYRNTEDSYQIKEKIRSYAAFSYGIYQDYFGLESLTICFVITEGGQTRLKQLLTWTEQELKQHQEDVSDLFLFGLCDPALISSLTFFCDNLYFSPFYPARQPLIEKRAGISTTLRQKK